MLLLGGNKVLGRIKQGEGPDSALGLVFATCAVEEIALMHFCNFLEKAEYKLYRVS